MGSLISKAFIPAGELLGCTTLPAEIDGEEGAVECLAPFSEPDWYWGLVQVLCLMSVYGYILFYASNMLSEGSELLLLVPSLAGVVGSVVLPILGAVPDGAIMLFSGLGPNAQEQLEVGVGTIAGSTIMLLTLPWAGAIYYGSVPIDNATGGAVYGSKRKRDRATSVAADEGGWASLHNFGVTPEKSIRSNAIIMVATSLIYLVIQGPAFPFAADASPAAAAAVADEEHPFALGGLCVALAAFAGYIYLMTMQSAGGNANHTEYLVNQVAMRAIESSMPMTIAGVIAPIIAEASAIARAKPAEGLAALSGELLDTPGKQQLSRLLKPFFHKYDENGDGHMSTSELLVLLRQLGEQVNAEDAKQWMHRLDPSGTGQIECEMFTDAMLNYIKEKTYETTDPAASIRNRSESGRIQYPPSLRAEEDDDDDED